MMGSSTTASATPSCLSRSTISAEGLSRFYGSPLDRAITVNQAEVPLRVALDRIASESRVRLTYSVDLLPRDKRVCLDLDKVPAGVALTELLRGTALRPLAIDGDNVVLAPSRGPTVSEPVPDKLNTISQLDQIVVTGTADGGKKRSSPFALEVIDGASLARSDASSLAAALDGAVPGIWMWTQSPSSTIGRGSVRGASSFGVTAPKIYYDGIEVANPLVLTQIDPSRVDRVEIIRGPQGAALYGADAISGVVNIISRHDGAHSGQPISSVQTRAGFSSSDYANGGAFVQDHSIGVRAGSGRRTFGVGVNVGTVGNYIPGGAAQSLLTEGDVRLVGSRTVFTGIARFAAKDAGALSSPLLTGVSASNAATLNTMNNVAFAQHQSGTGGDTKPQMANDSSARVQRLPTVPVDSTQSLRQYTVGTTSTFMQNARWTHTLVAGADGYRMDGMATQGVPVRLHSDSAPRPHSESDRTTLSFRSVARLGADDANNTTTITLGAEHAATRQQIETHEELRAGELSLSATSLADVTSVWSNTAGLLAQVNSSLHNSVFLSAGGRMERTTGFASSARMNFLPMLGAAYVKESNGQSLKLRASYGKGIRPSTSALRAATWMGGQSSGLMSNPSSQLSLNSLRNLEPEIQSGIEFGADITVNSSLGFHVTRFDQRATGLIQAVAMPMTTRIYGQQAEQGITYELQNVGAIANRGWELQATSMLGRLSLQAGASFVDSRVQQVAARYGGELLRGDRMLEVPARTFSLQAAYSTSRWSTSWTVARAMDWINYDQLRLAEQSKVPGFESKMITGLRLRDYWREYNGATRIRGNVSYAFSRAFTFTMSGDNLLNIQRGEPDNITVVPGRTLTAGIRTRF
ncbi:MAG: TonB-dependent receptor [Gemmatimonadaceae bacterium]